MIIFAIDDDMAWDVRLSALDPMNRLQTGINWLTEIPHDD